MYLTSNILLNNNLKDNFKIFIQLKITLEFQPSKILSQIKMDGLLRYFNSKASINVLIAMFPDSKR